LSYVIGLIIFAMIYFFQKAKKKANNVSMYEVEMKSN